MEADGAGIVSEAASSQIPWLARALDQAMDLVTLGGPVVAILLALSVLALAVCLIKLFDLAGLSERRLRPVGEATKRWTRGGIAEAAKTLEQARGPVARVARAAARGVLARRPDTLVREEVEGRALEELTAMRRYLRVLESVGQVAPLLGLFGTILGMIDVFKVLETAGSQVDPAALAGGIWVALLTTAVGLAIAIPCVLALHWFEGRIARQESAMEVFATRILANPPLCPGHAAPGDRRGPRAAALEREPDHAY